MSTSWGPHEDQRWCISITQLSAWQLVGALKMMAVIICCKGGCILNE